MPPLLAAVLGREARAQPARAARPSAWSGPRGERFPLILDDPGAEAQGLLVDVADPDELARLDYYELGFGYDLTAVTADGIEARMYRPRPGLWQRRRRVVARRLGRASWRADGGGGGRLHGAVAGGAAGPGRRDVSADPAARRLAPARGSRCRCRAASGRAVARSRCWRAGCPTATSSSWSRPICGFPRFPAAPARGHPRCLCVAAMR